VIYSALFGSARIASSRVHLAMSGRKIVAPLIGENHHDWSSEIAETGLGGGEANSALAE
jgi:hypothetical protein